MSDEARRVYLRFADVFLIVGGAFLVIGIVRATFLPDLLRGDPTLVALLLLSIGGALRWTVRDRGEADEADDGAGDDTADDAADDVNEDANDDADDDDAPDLANAPR